MAIKTGTEITHVGLVVGKGEVNKYDDSDFFAIVWNPETNRSERVFYASTRYGSEGCYVTVDASEEVMEAYSAYRKAEIAKAEAKAHEIREATPRVGKTIRIIKGRKLPKGTVAEVVWEGPNYFSRENAPYARLGLRLLDGSRVFVAAENCEVVR